MAVGLVCIEFFFFNIYWYNMIKRNIHLIVLFEIFYGILGLLFYTGKFFGKKGEKNSDKTGTKIKYSGPSIRLKLLTKTKLIH